jgi:hypothetical protein
MARLMTARFTSTCRPCGGEIVPGDRIAVLGRGRTVHANCRAPGTNGRGITEIRTSSGWVGYRNANGRCEDAPCCGCCTC